MTDIWLCPAVLQESKQNGVLSNVANVRPQLHAVDTSIRAPAIITACSHKSAYTTFTCSVHAHSSFGEFWEFGGAGNNGTITGNKGKHIHAHNSALEVYH